MAKNLVSGYLAPKFLEFIPSYHCTQYQGKLMNQPWEIEKKKLVLTHLIQIRANKFFFQKYGFVSR